jgi:tetratricopeptide (TPR) repeat protein
MAANRLETLLQFYEEDPGDPFTRFALASEYLKHGATEEALTFFEMLVRDNPDYVGTYYHLGKLYERLGRKEEARSLYRDGIQVAQAQQDFHARAELQDALLKAEGIGFDDDDAYG